jgi:hypothetical protein
MFGLPQVKADDHEDVYKVVLFLFQEKLKEALATILTQKNYIFWKLVNSFKMMK